MFSFPSAHAYTFPPSHFPRAGRPPAVASAPLRHRRPQPQATVSINMPHTLSFFLLAWKEGAKVKV
jgi:hypothetical protein